MIYSVGGPVSYANSQKGDNRTQHNFLKFNKILVKVQILQNQPPHFLSLDVKTSTILGTNTCHWLAFLIKGDPKTHAIDVKTHQPSDPYVSRKDKQLPYTAYATEPKIFQDYTLY